MAATSHDSTGKLTLAKHLHGKNASKSINTENVAHILTVWHFSSAVQLVNLTVPFVAAFVSHRLPLRESHVDLVDDLAALHDQR